MVIHAVYLINCASLEDEVRDKSLTALKGALTLGDRIGAAGVVLHPGSQKGRDYEECMRAVGAALREALAETESCPILLEDTAGAGGTLGREPRRAGAADRAGRSRRAPRPLPRLAATCWPPGSRCGAATALAAIVDEFDAKIGLERLQALHVNDSKMPLGSNRDRHAILGDGELGERGLRVFLSEPRFEGLPGPARDRSRTAAARTCAEVRRAKRLRREGLANRRRSRASASGEERPPRRPPDRRGVPPCTTVVS